MTLLQLRRARDLAIARAMRLELLHYEAAANRLWTRAQRLDGALVMRVAAGPQERHPPAQEGGRMSAVDPQILADAIAVLATRPGLGARLALAQLALRYLVSWEGA